MRYSLGTFLYNRLPIIYLCRNGDLDETNSLNILRFMLNIDPALPRELVGNGYLPTHDAVMYKSTAFCKILIDAYPESLRVESGYVMLPIHLACTYGKRDDTADTHRTSGTSCAERFYVKNG